MIARWPTDLPRPQRSGYQGQVQDPRIRRRSEAGPPGYRRRFSSVARIVTLAIDVSRDEKSVFDRFHQVETAMGSLPFIMPDPTLDGWSLLDTDANPLLTPDGDPLLVSAPWLCLFGDTSPVETIRGIRFQITFPVAVMP